MDHESPKIERAIPSLLAKCTYGEIYGTLQWDGRTTQFAAVTLGGTMDSDSTNQNAYLRATSTTVDTKVGALGGMWASGSNGDGENALRGAQACLAQS
jgi:hypothetical protein